MQLNIAAGTRCAGGCKSRCNRFRIMVSNFRSSWQQAWDMHPLSNSSSGSNLRLYARRHGVATGRSTNHGLAACLLKIVSCGGVKQLKPPAVSAVCPGSFATSVLFGVLLFVSTTVTIQRDCIMVVSTHAKATGSFDQLLERIAGVHGESMHVQYDLHTQFLANQGLSWWSLRIPRVNRGRY